MLNYPYQLVILSRRSFDVDIEEFCTIQVSNGLADCS